MTSLIKVGAVAYISQKALRCFGKKDYADVIAFCGWICVGIELYSLGLSIYAAITGSEIFSLVEGINNILDKIITFFS